MCKRNKCYIAGKSPKSENVTLKISLGSDCVWLGESYIVILVLSVI